MKIKILENDIIIIDRENIQRKFIVKKDYIKGTLIKNYFVYESYNYFEDIEKYEDIEEIENNMQFYQEFTNFEDLLKSIQEEE